MVVVVVLLSTTMANGIRTGGATNVGTGAPGPAAISATDVAPPPPVAAAATTVPSEKAALDDTYKDSKRKVPNGPDPIHNRRTRWGDAPARRV